MARKQTPAVVASFDPLDDPEFRMMVDFFALRPTLGDLSAYNPRQRELLRRSLAYRSFIRSGVENPGEGAVHSLDLIWERSNRPDGKSPREYLADPEREGGTEEGVEDRGEAGVFADWEAACWYAHHIDPEVFVMGDVLDQLY